MTAQRANANNQPINVSGTSVPVNVACYFADQVELLSNSERPRLKIPVARMGTFVHPRYGLVTFNQRDFDEIVENFSTNEAGFRPYLRYGHSRFEGAVDDSPSVGILVELQQENDVLWGIFDPRTDEVVSEIETEIYVNASAELKRYAISKRDGRAIGTLLTAVALTNAPFVPDLPNNQVLSDDAGSTTGRFMALDLSQHKGDTQDMKKKPDEVLSMIESHFGESLSISDEQRETLREKLSGFFGQKDAAAKEEAEADEKNSDADEEFSADSADALIEQFSSGTGGVRKNDPVKATADADYAPVGDAAGIAEAKKALGEDRMEKNSDSDTAEALSHASEEDQEKMSSFAEVLSNAANFFKAKFGKKADAESADEKNSQNLSDGSVTVGQSPSEHATPQEGETQMNEAQIKELVTQLLSQNTAELEQKFSTELAAKDEKIQSLETQLNATSTTAQQFSDSVLESAFTARKNGLVAAGIAPAVVDAVANIARSVRGTTQKFSDGTEMDAAEALFQALEKTPGEQRLSYDQAGQNLSDSDPNPYAEIIARAQSSK